MGDFSRILVPIDGSITSEKAARKAIALAAMTLGSIDFLYVATIAGGMNVLPGNNALKLPPDVLETLKESGNAVLKKIVEKAPPGIPIKSHCETGDPKEVIVALADRLESDVIIMGSRGLNPAQSLLIGSVSQYLIENANCPVLVVK